MSISFEKKSGKKQRGGGFYVAVALCCAAVCLVAWTTVLGDDDTATADDMTATLPTQDVSQAVEEYPIITDEQAAEQQTQDDSVEWVSTSEEPEVQQMTVQVQGDELSLSDIGEEAVQAAAPVTPAAPVFMMPVAGGELLKAFSAGALVYNQTMGDWRVHEGVDVACQEGEEIVCACSGTVYALYEDALYGNTAVVEHEDGSLLYYSGLADFSRLSQGMKLSAGDLMGEVGIVPCEAADGPHLHLAFMSEGGYIEPLAAMGLN